MKITLTKVKRDADFLRLARDLRYEAKRAALGEVVDAIKGVPTGKAYGSYHEEGLKTDLTYRAAFVEASLQMAEAAQARGELGNATASDEPAERMGVTTTVRDPQGLDGTKLELKPQTQAAICVESHYNIGAPISAAWLASRVADAFDVLRDDWTPALSIAEAWDQPLSVSAFLQEINIDLNKTSVTGFSFWHIKDAEKPRRPKRNLDEEYRTRAKHREACRHDVYEFDRLVTDDVAAGLVLNTEELACEALDLITTPEADPDFEKLRVATIRAGQRRQPLPLAYFEILAVRLNAGRYKPSQARTPSLMPGAVTGAHAVCGEYGLSLDELDGAIDAGTKSIVLRRGILVALRKKELSKRPKSEPRRKNPTSSAVATICARPLTDSAANDNAESEVAAA